ncbi:hypothetical protein Ancab_019945 [Ancistrocladus abbreviatus]
MSLCVPHMKLSAPHDAYCNSVSAINCKLMADSDSMRISRLIFTLEIFNKRDANGVVDGPRQRQRPSRYCL